MPFLPQERAKAIGEGKSKYFTGRPCKNGHVAERRVSNGCCVICEAEKYKQWSTNNPEKVKQSSLKSYINNAEKRRAYASEYRANNPEKVKATNKKSKAKRRSYYSYHEMQRQTKIKQATPSWLNKSDKIWMLDIYQASRNIKETYSVVTAVDHIIPIKGKNVCGLNVPWNLRIVTQKYNSIKLNRMEHHSPVYKQFGTIMVHESALPWNLRS